MKKKLLFISHYYHKKTRSCDFFIELLKEKYDVNVIFDESLGEDTSVVLDAIKEYDNIVFWQVMPYNNLIEILETKNTILCPMYDQVFLVDFEQWYLYRNFKIVCFSKFLYNKLKFSGFNAFYVQYFIEPKQFSPGKKDEIFFWHRVNDINLSKVLTLLKKHKFSLHVHTAVDPGQKKEVPSQEYIEKYNITFSDWFDTKEDMINCISQKGVFIAPRMKEGIGMSFLEAMALGKAVIANDEPTMNEYIKDNKNGYLCDFRRPLPIKFKNIEQVQRNAYEFAQKGYEKWLKGKPQLLTFINNTPSKAKMNIFSKLNYVILSRQITKRSMLRFIRVFYFTVFS